MSLRRLRCAWMPGFVLAVWAAPADAVIRVDMPVTKVYATARAVVAGTVVSVSPANRVLEVKVTETLKGEAMGDRLRVQIMEPAGLIRQVGPASPLVLFVGKARGGAVGAMHLADTWLIAKRIPQAKTPAWRTVQVHDARRTFPGRTAALVRIVKEIRAGKGTLLDKIEPKVFRGGPAKVADVMPNARFVASADLHGDGLDEDLVGGGGVRLLLNTKGKLADATAAWGLSSARGQWAAFGDVSADGKCDLLLGTTLYLHAGAAFEAAAKGLAIPDGPLAVALADATADGRPDVVALLPQGKLLVFAHPGRAKGTWRLTATRSLWTGAEGGKPLAAAFSNHWGDDGKLYVMVVTPKGLTRYAVAPGGEAPADHLRLTGERMGAHHKKDAAGWDVRGAAPIDINGDGRLDFFVVSAAGGEMLVNRGFGAFLINPDAPGTVRSHGEYKVPWARLSLDTPIAPADLHGDKFDDLLIVTKDGRLFELSNTPFPRHP